MTTEEKRDFLVSRGWHTWYNINYWVHPKKLIANADVQDYTNYGLSLDDAVKFEQENREPFSGNYMGLRW